MSWLRMRSTSRANAGSPQGSASRGWSRSVRVTMRASSASVRCGAWTGPSPVASPDGRRAPGDEVPPIDASVPAIDAVEASGPARRATIGMDVTMAAEHQRPLSIPSTSYHGPAPTPAHGASSLSSPRGSRPLWMASRPCSSSSSCWPSRSTTSTGSTTRPTRSRPRSRPGRSPRATPSSWRPRSTSSGRSPGPPWPRPSPAAWWTSRRRPRWSIAAALIGAIAWNLITWQQGLPSSSSHALIGGLLGATIVAAGTGALNINGIVNKVLDPDVHLTAARFLHRLRLDGRAVLDLPTVASASRWRGRFRRLQVGSAAFMAFAHGSNDAQKTMGIITLALLFAPASSTSSTSRPG